jgi:hypothetical protein
VGQKAIPNPPPGPAATLVPAPAAGLACQLGNFKIAIIAIDRAVLGGGRRHLVGEVEPALHAVEPPVHIVEPLLKGRII